MRFLFWSLFLISYAIGAQTTSKSVKLDFEKDLIPEGIAIDQKQRKVFINSLRHNKIVRCNMDGSQPEDFIQNGEHGYLSGFGMTIKGDTLFALGNSLPKPQNQSILLLMNTKTGEFIDSYSLDKAGFVYLNDLAISSKGEIYITDSESSNIYTINQEKSELEVFYSHAELKHCNGIAISDDDNHLYFASYTSGLRVLEVATKQLVNLPNNYKGIDGMKFYKDRLIAIVNSKRDPTQNGVYQFRLNKNQTKVIGEEKIWELKHQTDIPTTFAIEKETLYFISDSQLDNLDQETNNILDESKLQDYTLIINSLNPKVHAKRYCTEIGRFDLLFDVDEVAGAYLLKHKNALGGVWGKLDGKVMTGRWHDADGEGDIILTFNEDFSFFAADYRSDDDPEKWYKDSWHGALRPNSNPTFEFNTKTYTCE